MKKEIGFCSAGWSDCFAIWKLRNHPSVRQGMRNQREFGLLHHVIWMFRVLRSKKPRLFVIRGTHSLIAVGRLDYLGTGTVAEVDIYVAPEFMQRGFGSLMIGYLAREARASGAEFLSASVRRTNSASLALFRSRMFEEVREEEEENGGYVLLLRDLRG